MITLAAACCTKQASAMHAHATARREMNEEIENMVRVLNGRETPLAGISRGAQSAAIG
jgi:hypothetical protein